MAGSRETQDRQPIYGAVIPLARPAKLDRERLREELRAVAKLAGAGARMADDAPSKRGLLSSLTGKPDAVKVEIGGINLVISAVPKPLCSPSAMHSFLNPALWKTGVGGMTDHKGYLMVAEADKFTGVNGRDAMFDRATAVTLAAAAVANLGGGAGVIWLPGRNALPLGTFGSEMERFIDGQAPLLFWVRTQLLPAPAQPEHQLGQPGGEPLEPGIATVGLTAFIGAEIIAPPSHLDRDLVLDHVLALASVVIDENKDLRDGLLLGSGEGQVRIVARERGAYSQRPYWEIEPAKRPVVKAVPRPVPQPAAPPPQAPPTQAAPARAPRPQRPAPPAYPPMPDHGLGPNLGTLPKSGGALVDPDEVFRAAMSSTDPLDALPAALRPSNPDAARRATLGPDPALGQGLGMAPSSPAEDPDEALPAALRPVRPIPGAPPPIPPALSEPPAPAEPAAAKPAKPARRKPKRLPLTEQPDHGSLGTDIPRPSADELFSETPPEPEADDGGDDMSAKLRVVAPGGRR